MAICYVVYCVLSAQLEVGWKTWLNQKNLLLWTQKWIFNWSALNISSGWYEKKVTRVTCRYHVSAQATIDTARSVVVQSENGAHVLQTRLHQTVLTSLWKENLATPARNWWKRCQRNTIQKLMYFWSRTLISYWITEMKTMKLNC